MRRALTDLVLQKLPRTGKQYVCWDTAVPSFGARIYTGISFVLKRENRYIVLGRYPIVSLKQARDEAKRRLALKYFPSQSTPATAAVQLYLEATKGSVRPATHKVYELYLKRLPPKPLHEVSAPDVYNSLPEKKIAANLAFSTLRAFFSWCVERGHLQQNPLLKRRPPNRTASRDRLLSNTELASIWATTFSHGDAGALFRVLIASGQRISQFQNFNPAWLHTDHIFWPAAVMKNKTDHHLPLTPLIKANIPSNPVPDSRIIKLKNAIAVPNFRPHDFRRYVSSSMSAQRICSIDITEAILAHKSGSRSFTQRVYDRDLRIPQMKEALEKYNAHLMKVTDGNQPQRTTTTPHKPRRQG